MSIDKVKAARDIEIYKLCVIGGKTKAEVGRMYNISPRSVGRAIERVETPTNIVPVIKAAAEKKVEPVNQDATPQVKTPYSAVVTNNSIAMWHGGDSATIVADHPKFGEVYNIIVDGDMNQDALEAAFIIASDKAALNVLISKSVGDVTLDSLTETVSFKGRAIDRRLNDRIIDASREGSYDIVERLMKFTDRLHQNPSFRAVNELFSFIEATDIEIDDEGYVICFKRVSGTFKDLHTGTFDNRVGTTVSVARNMVDENQHSTCSYGLHVCSKSYLPQFGAYGGTKIVVCKVCPSDFVAIPVDYNNAKARVCKYIVLKDVTTSIII